MGVNRKWIIGFEGGKRAVELEHFCLRLAKELGFPVPPTQARNIGGTPVFIARRYDRTSDGMRRIHQEDFCQALSHPPQRTYQNQGGPGPSEIVALLREHSSKPEADVWRFFDALAFHWLIAGTDAHAKNYSLMIAGRGQVQLAPLYDLISSLPYPQLVDPRRAKLAMKIGGRYILRGKGGINGRSWEKCAEELGVDEEKAHQRIREMARRLPDCAAQVATGLKEQGRIHDVVDHAVDALAKWTVACEKSPEEMRH
ncbi:MAG: HipA domain-containing protein [Verrucomicrobiota bacterium]